jgi:hypothetical protein
MKKIILILLSALTFLQVSAQKLPQVQQTSLRAPAKVKIDGKATEWGQMKAYNKATELNYTIANDDKKLYMVAQTDIAEVYDRICNGGIKVVIQKNGRKSDEGAAFVKYPFFKEWNVFTFGFKATRARISFVGGRAQIEKIPEVKITSKEQADSIMQSHNKMLRENLKFIYTNGLPGIDSLVPIYNDKGIEAAVAFDNKRVYTYEMVIDLKLLGLTAQSGQKFAYHVVINGEPYKFSYNPGPGAYVPAATTDFWGEYTLAK